MRRALCQRAAIAVLASATVACASNSPATHPAPPTAPAAQCRAPATAPIDDARIRAFRERLETSGSAYAQKLERLARSRAQLETTLANLNDWAKGVREGLDDAEAQEPRRP